jgi:hypothetical protein
MRIRVYDVYREFSGRHLFVRPYKVHELIIARLKQEKLKQESAATGQQPADKRGCKRGYLKRPFQNGGKTAFTFLLFFGCQDERSGPAEYSDMKIKMKRFLLVTLAACVAIDLVVLWILW